MTEAIPLVPVIPVVSNPIYDPFPIKSKSNDTEYNINNVYNNEKDKEKDNINKVESSTKKKKTSPSLHASLRTVEQVLTEQNTDLEKGLSVQEADFRIKLHGPNILEPEDEETMIGKFMEQFKDPLIMLLMGSATISLLMGQFSDALSILLAIVIVLTVAFVQEYRSEKSLEALNQLVPNYCHVIRQGQLSSMLGNNLVPGDIVRFSIGDRIPADVRITQAVDLEIDESSLTGETKPCVKNTEVIISEASEVNLAERKNIGFMGTLVRNGYGVGIVIGTGKNTEFGTIFSMVNDVESKKTPLQEKMGELGKQISAFSIGIIIVIMIIGVIQGKNWLEMFNVGVSLAVAAIPEGLPICVTVTLALGVLRMAKRDAIVKKLPAVESLGSVNVICVDKTGTLTMNKMTVTKVYTAAQDELIDIEGKKNEDLPQSIHHNAIKILIRIGNLCNNAHISNGEHLGQPTEVALLEFGNLLNIRDERPLYPRISENAFNFEKKFMTVTCKGEMDKEIIFAKGAKEPIMQRCSSYYVSEDNIQPLTKEYREKISNISQEIASQGLRVLFMAMGTDMNNLAFVGFVAMYDPPRIGVGNAINTVMDSGVKIVMITGDSEGTAISIAQKLNIMNSVGNGYYMSGAELDELSENELRRVVPTISIFYRTTPKHKMAIVKALQANDLVVAMTGDGVNDAPALRLADIGISMGKSGTDVSKEAADMILVNDDFSTICNAIEEGKGIFYNIQNFLCFQLSTCIAALTLVTLSTLLNLPNPLNAMQILYINIICDGPVAQSLGVEAVDEDVMKQPPRNKNKSIIDKKFIYKVLLSSAIVLGSTLHIFHHTIEEHSNEITSYTTTMTFTGFVFCDIFNSLACRSSTKSIFKIGLFSNKAFIWAAGLSLLGTFIVVYVPFFQQIFQTEPLALHDILHLTLLSSFVLIFDEIRKFIVNKRNQKQIKAYEMV
ncbi:PMR1-type calcium-transporting P-type ATPase [Anaeromyces robustus]|uniref:Calcium-transporting ATPase n=1 Tax=Anaeromyces robustus TaxID=1754192 RepID=A0A1Y1XCA3_9FUNG|nr:PMR1-type calcium-transporting P-type ATPase [Anaeromyces robustus]|eukprot:ORX83353.1 PMR1-type calcium-transporting P-type ATPase [Anaeromyces robustus]